jgi:hypothetical protein
MGEMSNFDSVEELCRGFLSLFFLSLGQDKTVNNFKYENKFEFLNIYSFVGLYLTGECESRPVHFTSQKQVFAMKETKERIGSGNNNNVLFDLYN